MSATPRSAETSDLPGIATLLDAVWADLDQPIAHSAEELTEEFDSTATSLADVMVWESDNGDLSAVGYTLLLAGDDLARCYLFGGVHPEARHHGIGTELIDHLIARASERLRALSSRRLVMRTHRPSTSTAAASILSARGFTVARYFTDMHRSTTEPPTVDLPDGYEIATWDNERAEELRELKNLAFSDHWGSTPSSVESWDETISSSPTRLDLSRTVSTANGEIVGLLLTRRHPSDDEILGAPYAWMDLIATHPAHRGRGIAAAMIADALRAYREEGISRAALEVDADSPTGADRLYVGLGFEPWRATETDEMEVEPLTAPDGATSPPSA